MSALRKSAEGQECMVRIPGVCNGNPETTVLAHLNVGGISGMGMKSPDVCGVFACSDCHDVIDGRRGLKGTDGNGLQRWILEGHLRTLKWWQERGYLAVRAGV